MLRLVNDFSSYCLSIDAEARTTKEQIFQEAFNLPLIIPLTLDLRDSELEQDRDDSVLAFARL